MGDFLDWDDGDDECPEDDRWEDDVPDHWWADYPEKWPAVQIDFVRLTALPGIVETDP